MKWSTLLVVVLFSLQKPVSGYKAAVLEYQPTVADTAQNTILKNLEEYRKFAEKAAAQQVDILVFPEYGLTTLVVDPEDYAVKITNTNENVVIKKLRLLARDHHIYVVVNLLEEVGEQEIYYNTNLVFDRTGSVISK
jgi:predicted amidohydrolase